MVCIGRKADLLLKLQLFSKANGKFNSIDKLFGQVVSVETKPQKCDKKWQKPPGESSCLGEGTQFFRIHPDATQDISQNLTKLIRSDMLSGSGGSDEQPLTMATRGGLCIMEREWEMTSIQWQQSWNIPISQMLQAEVPRQICPQICECERQRQWREHWAYPVPMMLWQLVIENQVCNLCDVVQQGKLEEMELGMEESPVQAPMATLD